MTSIAHMSMALINSPMSKGLDAALLSRRYGGLASPGSDHGLSDAHSSPRSAPMTPDSFVVTPEGRALLGIRELHVDPAGSVYIIDRVPEVSWDPIVTDTAPLPRPKKLPFTIPVAGLQETPIQCIGWHPIPQIAWGKQVESAPPRTVQIFTVDAQGTTRVKEVSLKEFQKRYNADRTQDYSYVVEENGVVHLAHSVFIGGPEAQVVLRDDDDVGGVYDSMPTPHPTLSPFSDIVFITEPDGKVHYGTTVMVTAKDGTTNVVNRIASWPALFVKNTDSSPKYIAYTAPPRIGWNHKEAFEGDGDCFVATHPGGVTETYNRILLASNESVFLAYRAASNTDAIILSDGERLSVKCLIKKPCLTAEMEPIIITTPGKQGVSHYGVNVLISMPGGFYPVARVASVSREAREKMQEGLESVGAPLLLAWPQQLQITNHPQLDTEAATKTRLDRFASSLSDKVAHLDQPLAAPSSSYTRVIIGKPNSPGVKTIVAVPAWDGVLLAGKGPLKLGHSVICMGQDSAHSKQIFTPDEA